MTIIELLQNDNYELPVLNGDKAHDEALKKNSGVSKVSHRIQGKTLNYYITFTEKVSVKDAKSVGDSLVKELDEDTLGYYSLQVYVNKKNPDLKDIIELVSFSYLVTYSGWWNDH